MDYKDKMSDAEQQVVMEELLSQAGSLERVPPASHAAYRRKVYALLDDVNGELDAREDIERLRGGNPRALMLDNHRNHALFMANVFYLNRFTILAKALPWVYRTYRKRGFASDYFPVQLNAWVRAIRRHIAAEPAAPLIRIYRWIIENHGDFEALSRTAVGGEAGTTAPQWEETLEDFLGAVLKGNKEESLRIAMDHAGSAARVRDFYLNILQPAMYRVGLMWESNQISVAEEHLATAMVNRIMAVQHQHLDEEQRSEKGKVLVTAAHNEFHELGAQMVAGSLEMDGWEVVYLGANTPNEEIEGAVEKFEPMILAVSVTMPFNLEGVDNLLDDLRGSPGFENTRLLLGGLVFNSLPELRDSFAPDGFAASCTEAVDVARAWWEEDSGP